MFTEEIITAIILSLFAGLSTCFGFFVILIKKLNTKFLSIALGFSAGVMIYVSFVELLGRANAALERTKGGEFIVLAAFFGGILLIGLIDKIIPKKENPHELPTKRDIKEFRFNGTAEGCAEVYGKSGVICRKECENCENKKPELKSKPTVTAINKGNKSLLRVGIMSALAIAIHNFPEGLATFTAAYQDVSLGVSIALAVAIHNIPEGISVALPVYSATNSKGKAFFYTFVSGLCEPVGAVLGFLILKPFINDIFMGVLFSFVAGIMVFISLDELLPAAREYGKTHHAIYGLVAGMLVMAVSLILL